MKTNEIIIQLPLEILRKIYVKLFGPSLSKDGHIPEIRVTEKWIYSKEQEEIKAWINSDRPCFLGRMGSIELDCYNNYQQILLASQGKALGGGEYKLANYLRDKSYAPWVSIGTKNGMTCNAGFFPATNENIMRYGKLIDECMDKVDVLLHWWEYEKFLKIYDSVPKILMKYVSYPFYYTNPWTSCLQGKKVLVISPFSETIKKQYSIRKKLFKDVNILPEFELITLQSYNVLRGKNNTDAKDWFDALEKMENRINQIDFDIALIGCGAYAFPLGAYCKNLGKKAITICGGIQLLFGIYGKRWENSLKRDGIINEYWTRPLDEKPFGYEKVEGGAYW